MEEREGADHSIDIRSAREAATLSLLDHPYICAMRGIVYTEHHWYILLEYVSGGQLLDYVIAHGRVKEKQARKFARQLTSTLDYCHRNSITHRNICIENIMITTAGDIKLVAFGCSKLFSPDNHLETMCGSTYFVAPEILRAKSYVGPEVDIWSIGIVLYILVCGRVPFDDRTMPLLQQKIMEGFVEYPPWLSAGK
jgi:serine/threonine protein kinase